MSCTPSLKASEYVAFTFQMPTPCSLTYRWQMLAGDNSRGVYNASNAADQAISYVCLGKLSLCYVAVNAHIPHIDYNNDHSNDPAWYERQDFFQHQCPGGMRAQVYFPSCWDGVNLDSPDHKSHVSYPIGLYNDGACPPSHPKRSDTYKSNTTKASGRSAGSRPALYPSESSSTLVGSALERKIRDEDPIPERPDTTSRLDSLRNHMRAQNLDY